MSKVLVLNGGMWGLEDTINTIASGTIAASKMVESDIVLSESQITSLTSDLGSKLSGNQTIALSGDASGSGATSIAVTLANSGVTAGTYKNVTVNAKGLVTSAQNPTESTATRTIQTVAAAANGWQLSSTRDSLAFYSVSIQATGLTEQGDVVIEVSPTNSSSAGSWIEKGRVLYKQAASVTLGILSLTQAIGGVLSTFVPAGSFVRIRSINTTGSPSFTYLSGQEVLL